MSSVLVVHPSFGSVWLSHVERVLCEGREFVVGEAWDTSDVGSPYMPDDFGGMPITMNFPITCVRKWAGHKPRIEAVLSRLTADSEGVGT